jgi:hypothetical protein
MAGCGSALGATLHVRYTSRRIVPPALFCGTSTARCCVAPPRFTVMPLPMRIRPCMAFPQPGRRRSGRSDRHLATGRTAAAHWIVRCGDLDSYAERLQRDAGVCRTAPGRPESLRATRSAGGARRTPCSWICAGTGYRQPFAHRHGEAAQRGTRPVLRRGRLRGGIGGTRAPGVGCASSRCWGGWNSHRTEALGGCG